MIDVYNWGIFYLSICTDETDIATIERLVNEKVPTGIYSKWKMSEDKTFKGGQPNPCLCLDKPGFKHYLLSC